MIGENTMNDEVRLDDDCNRESTGNNSARENEQPADWNLNNRVKIVRKEAGRGGIEVDF